ncbi:uncharacterized protein F5Z01DRAFT_665730 [Emericellopsis atlantica]|uniref:Uncharacterized protein n=1 Tax=Emericellopsis atlantica TaxID=2614577 RepID=A0A9P8CL66_9HYPO|nr:uncharacterized protein F5Z01DRAFT_665730 [Emericellopsis atlantica]KAG9250680.1 hypothetical protein F5Z01DRAFT_665730 [Emericellopsis atlantica]
MFSFRFFLRTPLATVLTSHAKVVKQVNVLSKSRMLGRDRSGTIVRMQVRAACAMIEWTTRCQPCPMLDLGRLP